MSSYCSTSERNQRDERSSCDTQAFSGYHESSDTLSNFFFLSAQVPHEADPVEADGDMVEGLSEEVIAKIDQENAALTKGRKELVSKRKAALSGVEKLHNYTTQNTLKDLHAPGKHILCMDMSKADNTRVVTGGADNTVVVYDTKAGAVLSKFDGHKGEVSKVAYHSTKDVVASASDDSTVRVWSLEG